MDDRRRQYGLNQPLPHRRRPLWLQFLARFLNPLVLILLFASALSAATGNVTSFVIVIVMVVRLGFGNCPGAHRDPEQPWELSQLRSGLDGL